MTQEQVEKLLQPRYKVIATYPKCHWSVGKVLTADSEGWFEVELDWRVELEYMDAFPHLFRKLEWWEEREVSEMPEYVKIINTNPIAKVGEIIKTNKWNSVPNKFYFIDADGDHAFIFVSDAIPATEQDYLTYKQNQVTV
ncbi:MAG: hypothetical protein KA981_11640 [Bacteroidia bacterium]|nr:hypothetical protein [Bacteroidia bacterium]